MTARDLLLRDVRILDPQSGRDQRGDVLIAGSVTVYTHNKREEAS